MEPIPVDLIAGMRRAGKTSLINGLLCGPYRGQQTAVFTNEEGNTPCAAGSVTTVLGGCICCTAQTELVAKIRNCLWFEGPDRLIIEMSGKGTIRDMLQIFSYLPQCRLDQLIYVLDAGKFQALSAVMGDGFRRELETAPVIALSNWQPQSPQARQAILQALEAENRLICTDITHLDVEASRRACRQALNRLCPARPRSAGAAPIPGLTRRKN